MSKDPVIIPTARTWKSISQDIKPRAMSREGKRRLTLSGLRVVGVALVIAGVAWGSWEVRQALQENPNTVPDSAKTVALKHLELRTDGVLGNDWLARTLALPKNASLMELDLQSLRQRLLASGQVTSASLTKSFPETLKVQVAERSPVARLMAELHGEKMALLVARDGVVFEGVGYDVAMIGTLPWLDGVELKRTEGKFQPVENMGLVADLLGRARFDAEHLYKTWQVVSLARLKTDGELIVRTKPGTAVVFGAHGDFFQQIAKLDYHWDTLLKEASPPAKIDLSLGREVLVSFQTPGMANLATSPSAAPTPAKSAPAPAYNFFPNSQPKPKL